MPKRVISEVRKAISLHGVSKAELGDDRRVMITSIGTERVTAQAERSFMAWRTENCLPVDGPFLRTEVVEFLQDYAEVHGQAALDATRLALARLLSLRLAPVESLIRTVSQGRATRIDEIRSIIVHQRERNALATLVAHDAGLRAAELLTLRRADELDPSAHRNWPATMFLGRRDFVRMVTTGKGGLRRPIALARCLFEELEKRRRSVALVIEDRGVRCESVYDIAGGQAFSQSFANASLRALGRSTGAHGLRHAYAQRRVRELMDMEYEFMVAVQMVSIELGHFRPIFAYYQPR